MQFPLPVAFALNGFWTLPDNMKNDFSIF